jgi:basic amino acid/polyamine antiporter, APA family
MGLMSATMVVVGGVIGSGIFLKPLVIAQSLPDAAWIHGCWIVLGVVCLLGALCYAELGAMVPEAGGQYAFLRESFGPFPAFLYGWCLCLVINTGTTAALAVAFAESLSSVVPLAPAAYWSVALGMILVLAVANVVGVGVGAVVQNVATFAKIAMLAAIVLGGIVVAAGGGAAPGALATSSGAAPVAGMPASGGAPLPDLLHGVIAAGVAIFWAYEGWYQLPFSCAEMKQPERTLPRALVLGIAILVVLYVTVNATYLAVIPRDEMASMAKKIDVPATAMARIFGGGGAKLLPLMICISVFGAANPNLLSTPRALYAMARDGLIVRPLMAIHPRFQTPHLAIWSQAIWAALLVVVLKNFTDITNYVVFASLLFYGLTAAGVIVLRYKRPDAPRPFRCPLVPLVPALFIAVVLAVDVLTLASPDDRKNALIGLAILAAGVPVYFLLRGRRRREAARAGP